MNRVLVTFHLSDQEKTLLDALASGNKSAYLRNLILADAKAQGFEIPQERLEDTRAEHGFKKHKP